MIGVCRCRMGDPGTRPVCDARYRPCGVFGVSRVESVFFVALVSPFGGLRHPDRADAVRHWAYPVRTTSAECRMVYRRSNSTACFRQSLRVWGAGALSEMWCLDGRVLAALGGSEYFRFRKLHYGQCPTRRMGGRVEYFHSFVCASMVAPGQHRIHGSYRLKEEPVPAGQSS